MTLNSIITPMNFTLVRDAVCQLLANERDAQIELAQSLDVDNWLAQNLSFVVYPKRFRFPDIKDMPCVFVYINEMEFPEDLQDIYENFAHANLQIDYYAVGKAETGIVNGEKVLRRTADENAADRLEYLTAQIYKTLCNENNVKKGTNGLVTRTRVKKWERVITPEDTNTAATVLGASFSLELGFNEPTYFANTTEVQEFYSTLEVKDEFIDPFVRRTLGNE